MQPIRIYELPKCKMATSGTGMFGQPAFDAFEQWFSTLPRSMHPRDFLCAAQGGFCWLYLCDANTTVPEQFAVTDHPGGLYAVYADIDGHTDADAPAQLDAFLAQNNLQRDTARAEMGHIITSPAAAALLGYEQMEYYVPVCARK